jgi:hypothetical protein
MEYAKKQLDRPYLLIVRVDIRQNAPNLDDSRLNGEEVL